MMRKGLFASALIFLCLTLVGCPPGNFQKKKMPPLFFIGYTMDTGPEPSFLISEDFNNDGKLDLVVTNSGGHSFSLFKGKGDGTFKDQLVFKTGQDPICVVAADFNNDGYLDVAVLDYADQDIQVYLNTQFGSFLNTGKIIKPGKIPVNLTAGDFNEDGFADLAVTMRYHKIEILFGKGNGEFGSPNPLAVKGQPTGIIVGDYNLDNHLDIAIALAGSGNTGVQIIWGQGDKSFKPSELFRGGGQPLTIANLDVNNDGYLDLITSSNVLHSMTMLVNNGDGTFTTLKDFASGNFPKFVAAEDFTGDGYPDLAVSNSTDDFVSVSLGRGDGTFTYPPIYHGVDEYPQGIATGDFNDDGLIDLAVACRDKKLIDVLIKKNMVNPNPKPVTASKTT